MHDFPNLWAFLFFKMNLVMYACMGYDTLVSSVIQLQQEAMV